MSAKTLTPRIEAGIIKDRTEPVFFAFIDIGAGLRKCTRGYEEGDLENLPKWNGFDWSEGVRVGAKTQNKAGSTVRRILLDNIDRSLNSLLITASPVGAKVQLWRTYDAPPWAVNDVMLDFEGEVIGTGNLFGWAELICSTQSAQNKETPWLTIPSHMTQYAPRPGTTIDRNGESYRIEAQNA